MKKFILGIVTFIFLLVNNTVFASGVPADFTGESFFRAPMEDVSAPEKQTGDTESYSGTIPIIKLFRLKLREHNATKQSRAEAKAKRKAIKQAMKLHEKNKNADLEKDIPTGEDIEHLELGGVEDLDSPERIVITCDNMDYVTEEALLNARGHVVVNFVQEGATLSTDHLIYDKKSNNITAVGNVVISKKGIDVYGESINVDLNKENAIMDKPLSKLSSVSVSAEKGYVYQDKIIQENGTVKVDSSLPINLEPHGKAPKLKKMMIGLDDTSSIDDFVGESGYRIKVSHIIINSDKKLESLELRKAQIYKGEKKLFTLPWLKFYTNKNHDFVDGDFPEIASRRHLGFFAGPGWAFKMPFGSLLKVAPIVAYRSGDFGVGGFARFMSGTNTTEFGYATARDKFVLRGEQILDDNLKLQYAANDYMDNWFMGRRMPKYGVDLVYNKKYELKDFIYKDLPLKYTHQASFGLFGDPSSDKYYRGLKGNGTETTRARYMMEVAQKVWNFKDEENLLAADISIVGQASSALYGTGDTQFVGRIGPRLHTQYKKWMQDLGYFQSGYHDKTPLPVFDSYRYGHSNLYLREYFRVHRLLTLSWLASVTLTDDSPNNKLFQECSFFVSIGPDDMKLNVGYDVIRENAYVTVSVGLDSKGTVIDYDKLEIKNPEMFKPEDKTVFYVGDSNSDKSKSPTILQRAVVEDVIFDMNKGSNGL